jgi:hypothetical protein
MTTLCLLLCLAASPEFLAWDGFDRFFALLEREGVALRDVPRTDCIFVLGQAPAGPLSAEICAAVRNGATLCLATESARARPLLDQFSLRLGRDVFLTLNPFACFKGQPDCPVISDFSARVALFDDVEALVANRAREISGAGTPLAFFPTPGAVRPAFMREVREGRGRVIAIGDQSIFINLMLPERNNEQFLRNVLGNARSAIVYIHGQRCARARDATVPLPRLDGRIPIPDLAPNVQDLNALLADVQDAAPVQSLNAQAFPILCCLLGVIVVWTFLRCILAVWLPPRKPFGASNTSAQKSRAFAGFVKELTAAGRGSAAQPSERTPHAHRQ